jgi:predicted PurR-regulated permease PerM
MNRVLEVNRRSDPPGGARPSLAQRLAHGRVSRSGLFFLVLIGALYLARSVVIPFVFGLMLYLLLRPGVRLLARMRLPKPLGAAIVLGAVVAPLGLGSLELASPAADWAQRLPAAVRQLEFKSRALKAPMDRLSAAAGRIEQVAGATTSEREVPRVAVVRPGPLANLVSGALRVLAQGLITLVATYLLLVCGDTLLERLFRLVPDLEVRARAGSLVNTVEQRMSQYLRTVTLINLGLGVVLALSLSVVGMPNPVLWGGLAALVNFVPYLGPAVGITVVGAAALVTFDTLAAALLPPILYLAMTTIEGNLLTPWILGRAFRISPLDVFAWVVFWGWMWSVPGAALAVPLLMLMNIVFEQSRSLAAIPRLLRS